jgi:hypothetical protein
MITLDEKINPDLSESISRFLLNNDDPEELINFLNTEEEKEIYDLTIGENQSTSKYKLYKINSIYFNSFTKCNN